MPTPLLLPAGQTALATALRVAFEMTVLCNQFELDELEPLSRLDALTEAVVQELHQLDKASSIKVDGANGVAEALLIIRYVSACVRDSIRNQEHPSQRLTWRDIHS